MKPLPRPARLMLPILATLAPGFGCGHGRPVTYPWRRGAPLRVESAERPGARPAPIDLKAPTPAADQAGTVDVPLIDPDAPSPG